VLRVTSNPSASPHTRTQQIKWVALDVASAQAPVPSAKPRNSLSRLSLTRREEVVPPKAPTDAPAVGSPQSPNATPAGSSQQCDRPNIPLKSHSRSHSPAEKPRSAPSPANPYPSNSLEATAPPAISPSSGFPSLGDWAGHLLRHSCWQADALSC
jgi:hypothetical protein